MLLFVSEGRDHDPGPGHVELPARIDWCLETLSRATLSADVRVDRREFEPAKRDELLRVHHPLYLDDLKDLCDSGGGWLPGPTFVGKNSLEAAERAAGACVAAASAATQEQEVSLALVRPPGHHAERAVGQGFCLINNAAVAAEAIREAGVKKVAIVDIDVHHGNGTQQVFWEDEDVLYISLHQYPWYPWVTGALGEVGAGAGEGRNVNVPLPAGSNDETYIRAFARLVDPIVSSFSPDFLVVSAGFDAHQRDGISLMEVTSSGFGLLGSASRQLADRVCDGKLLIVLEGGYDREGLSSSLAEFVVGSSERSSSRFPIGADRADRADRAVRADIDSPSDRAVEAAVAFHLPHWT